MRSAFLGLSLLFIAFISSAHTWKEPNSERALSLSQLAVSENKAESVTAIGELREMGYEGLNAMFEAHSDKIKAFTTSGAKTPEWLKVAAALDAVAMQKDSYASNLYWHTDLEKAKAEAQKSGKPILSLRLLGNLNEELSCANSRFFRTALYPNAQISKLLQERFILHWQSVRPAPRVTIDFGDGRKMETTLTGNSIHYVLDSNGKAIDALPGLYGPHAFEMSLEKSLEFLYMLKLQDPKMKPEKLARFYRDHYAGRLQTMSENWESDLRRAKVSLSNNTPVYPGEASFVSSITASRRAMAKMVTEVKILPATVTQDRLTELEKDTDLDKWRRVAEMRQNESVLDESSRNFIARKLGIKGAELDKLVKQFEKNLALDTVRNEYLFHSKLFAWLHDGSGNDLNKFNEKIYAELFLTPSADPWLGLYAPEIYNGIENSGITK